MFAVPLSKARVMAAEDVLIGRVSPKGQPYLRFEELYVSVAGFRRPAYLLS